MKYLIWILVIILAIACSHQILQVRADNKYTEKIEREFISKWINGNAGNPYQFRALQYWTMFFLYDHIRRPQFQVYHLKYIQAIIIFLLVFWWCRLYSKSPFFDTSIFAFVYTVIGTRNNYCFDTWFDLIFYLLAFIAVHYKKYWWVIPITALASINRETFLFFNIFFLVYAFYQREDKAILPAMASMLVFWVGFYLMRAYMPFQANYNTGYRGLHYGLDMFLSNFRLTGVSALLASFGFLGWWRIKGLTSWPRLHTIGFFIIFPLFLISYLWCGNIDEVRLISVPFTLFVIPGITENTNNINNLG